MALEFNEDAICLSGLTGSKLKCQIIGQYYTFWWNITSGGDHKNYDYPTAIVELDAATGEVFIKETNETMLGSSGHALELKSQNPNTRKLKIILVERDSDCYGHLRKVINRRWGNVDVGSAEGPIHSNSSNIYLLNDALDQALDTIGRIPLGNALFFFDPLRSVEYQVIEKVTSKRIKTFYKEGTELVIFVFTSDWFLGRDDFAPLPNTASSTAWSPEEAITVAEADSLFGDKEWRAQILAAKPIYERESKFIEIYRNRLHKWFRYVLPLPFNPKEAQIYHLIMCSNYEVGVKTTRDFYSKWTGNPKYLPNNNQAFQAFKKLHLELFEGLTGQQRPPHWKMLWETIKYHEEGICDHVCRDFMEIERDNDRRLEILQWLEQKEYLITHTNENVWNHPYKQYRLNWKTIKANLGVDPPVPLEPLSVKEIC